MKHLQNLGLCLLLTLIVYQGFRIHFLSNDIKTQDKEFNVAFKRLNTLETKTQFTYDCLAILSRNVENVQRHLGIHWDNQIPDSIQNQLLKDSLIWNNHSHLMDTGYSHQDPGVDVNSGKYKKWHKIDEFKRLYLKDTLYYTGRNKNVIIPGYKSLSWTQDQEDPYSKKWLGSKDTTQSFVTCLMTLKHYKELDHPFFPVVNYGDSTCDDLWFYIRYQMAWGEHHGGEILSHIVDRIPNDSIKAWMGSHIYDSIWKAESEQH